MSLGVIQPFILPAIFMTKHISALSNLLYKVLALLRGLKLDLESNKEAKISSAWKAPESVGD